MITPCPSQAPPTAGAYEFGAYKCGTDARGAHEHGASARGVHAYTPVAVVAAALLFHAARHPVPLATLALLVTASYGKTAWREFMRHRRLTARLGRRTVAERARVTETVTHRVRERPVRDTVLAVQPTTR